MPRARTTLGWCCGLFFCCGSAAAQCAGTRLFEPGLYTNANYGNGVALAQGRAYAAAPVDLDADGSVFVYERVEGEWTLVQQLRGEDLPGPFDWLSSILAVQGETLAVGDPGNPYNGDGAGALHMFERVGGAWVYDETLIHVGSTLLDEFGSSVDIDGDWLVVGAPRADPGPDLLEGRAYLFQRTAGSWVESDEIRATAAEDGAAFGDAVAISGERALVGAPSAGKAYVFEFLAPDWHQTAQFEGNGPSSVEYFGAALALEGDTAVVGAPFDNAVAYQAGSVYVFEHSGGAWTLVQELTPADLHQNDHFGNALALQGDRLLVGTYPREELFLYERVAGVWHLVRTYLPPANVPFMRFGWALDVDGDTVLAGAPWHALGGSAYVFSPPWLTSPFCTCDSGAPCGNGTSWSGCANSTGAGGRIHPCGTTSVSSDDLVLVFETLPPGQTLLAWNGGDVTQLPFGDGQRCVAPGSAGIYRFLPPSPISPQGTAKLGPGIVAHTHATFPSSGHIAAGDTWYFQGWYRDPLGPCGSGFNLTHGLRATFAP